MSFSHSHVGMNLSENAGIYGACAFELTNFCLTKYWRLFAAHVFYTQTNYQMRNVKMSKEIPSKNEFLSRPAIFQ